MKDDYLRRAIVKRVVDGDTIDVDVDLGYKITTHQRLRLARIDTPEIRGKERAAGLKAMQFVVEILKSSPSVYVKTFKAGKFGRYIAEVWYHNEDGTRWTNLNDDLLEKGLAKPYGKK